MQQTKYQILPMTEEYAKQISHWTYEGEYSIYSFQPDEETLAELLDGSYFCLHIGAGAGWIFLLWCFGDHPDNSGKCFPATGRFSRFWIGNAS